MLAAAHSNTAMVYSFVDKFCRLFCGRGVRAGGFVRFQLRFVHDFQMCLVGYFPLRLVGCFLPCFFARFALQIVQAAVAAEDHIRTEGEDEYTDDPARYRVEQVGVEGIGGRGKRGEHGGLQGDDGDERIGDIDIAQGAYGEIFPPTRLHHILDREGDFQDGVERRGEDEVPHVIGMEPPHDDKHEYAREGKRQRDEQSAAEEKILGVAQCRLLGVLSTVQADPMGGEDEDAGEVECEIISRKGAVPNGGI